jgi:hypothetical protein
MPYPQDVVERLWHYKNQEFDGQGAIFEQDNPIEERPPVFKLPHSSLNILSDPQQLNPDQHQRLIQAIPIALRHRWFRSMKSSQALA